MSESLPDRRTFTLREQVARALIRQEGFDPDDGDGLDAWLDHADAALAVVAEALYERCLDMPANHPARLGYRAASRMVRGATHVA